MAPKIQLVFPNWAQAMRWANTAREATTKPRVYRLTPSAAIRYPWVCEYGI